MRWNAGVLLGLGAASAIVGCEVVAGLDHDVALTAAAATGSGGGAVSTGVMSTTASGSTNASSASGSTSSTGGGVDKCGVTFPSYPSGADEGGEFSFTVATHSINLGDQGVVGLDLDKTCSCHGKGASCIEPVEHCDDEEGRDTSARGLFAAFAVGFGSTFSSAGLTAQAEAGNWSILYRVRGYNGMANDGQVELDWYLSTGFDKTTASKPQWNGKDAWKVAASFLNGASLEEPLYRDTHAYVSNNMLVASIPETPLPFPVGGLGHMSFTLSGAGLLARVFYDAEFGVYRLIDGQMVGLLKLADVFKTMSSFRDNNGKPICTNSFFYGIMKNNFCDSADILAATGVPSSPCDAISFAMGFIADPAVLGAVDTTVPPMTQGCPPATDPATDQCSP